MWEWAPNQWKAKQLAAPTALPPVHFPGLGSPLPAPGASSQEPGAFRTAPPLSNTSCSCHPALVPPAEFTPTRGLLWPPRVLTLSPSALPCRPPHNCTRSTSLHQWALSWVLCSPPGPGDTRKPPVPSLASVPTPSRPLLLPVPSLAQPALPL